MFRGEIDWPCPGAQKQKLVEEEDLGNRQQTAVEIRDTLGERAHELWNSLRVTGPVNIHRAARGSRLKDLVVHYGRPRGAR